MVTSEYTLILTPSGSKMALPPRKPPQHKNKSLFPQTVIFQKLKYICIINMYVIDIDIDIDIDSLFLKIRTRHCHEKNCLIKKFSHTMRA
jgi:hypothetical protein